MLQFLPALWRYLLQGYFRVLTLSVVTFLAILIVTRFKEIARFTALSGDWGKTLLFTAYQFPLILPMAIPISALIASLLLFQRLSRTHELTALRASGLSFGTILAPLLLAAALFSIVNFSMCAEIAPFCRRESKIMLFRETSANPLLLLERQQLVKLKHAYLTMQVQEEGKNASDVTLITYNESYGRLNLFQARELSVEGSELSGRDVVILTHLDSPDENHDTLIIENQALMSTQASILSLCLKKSLPRLQANAMTLRMLLLQAKLEKKKLASSARVEILKRTSLSLAVFSFTFLGCAFGITTGRREKQNYCSILLLALTVLATYLSGKEFKSYPTLAIFIFLLPHPVTWAASIWRLKKISHGVSS